MVEVSNNFIQECEANVGTYKFGKIKVNYIDDNPFNYEQGAYSSSNGTKIDAEQSIRYNKLVECEPNFKYKIELGNSAYKMKIVTYNANQAFIAAHDNLIQGSELTTEATAKYISVTIYSNDTLEGTNITLNNTIRNGEISGAELKGNTTQDGTPTPSSPVPVNNVTGEQVVRVCGKNLFDVSSLVGKTYNGTSSTTRVCNSQAIYLTPGTYTFSTNIDTSVYEFKTDVLKNPPTSSIAETYIYNSGFGTSKPRTITIASAGYFAILIRDKNNANLNLTTLKGFEYQLEKGSSASDYQEYQSKDYEINLGKNLLDLNLDKVVNQNGITYSVESDGTITINGTATAKTDIWYLNNQLKSSANKVYSLNFIYISGTLNGTMNVFNQDGNNGWKGFNVDLNGTGALSNKSAVGSYPVNLDMQGAIIRVKKDAVVDNLKFKLTFVQSSVADYKYAPYFTPIELNKIGNYQDFIRKGTGKNLLNLIREQGTFTGNGTQFDENSFYPNMARDSGVGSGCETIGYANNVLTIKGRYGQGVGYPIKCMPNTQYCVKAKSSDSNARLWVSFYDNAGNFISGSANNTDLERIVTTPNNAYWLIVVFGVNGSSYTNVNYSEIQIEINSQATSYEPYACTGKNLFDSNTDIVEGYTFGATDNLIADTRFFYQNSYISVSPNTSYCVKNPSGSSLRICEYNQNKEFIQRDYEKYVFTTTSNTYYVRVSDFVAVKDLIQLERGTQPTSFEPYIYSTLKDKWYIEKNVGKVVLDGSQEWTYYTATSKPVFFLTCEHYGINYKQQSGLICYSNYYLGKGQVNSFDNVYDLGNNVIAFRTSYTRLVIRNDSITSVADFKTWLNTHNTSVYYVLKTPEYTLIENEDLIEQLDAVSHAETQEGTTNITSSGILPAILEVTPNLIESIRGKQTTPIVGYNITGDDDLINFKITSKADSNGNILGATSQSQVDIEIFNKNNAHNLENKQVYISTGLNETEGNYCKWQPFTITQTKDTQTKNHTTYTGYDDMMRGNGAYIDNVDYGEEGITLYDFTCKLAKEMGMALGNTTMTNGDFIVKGNNFTNNETKLVVLKNVAQMVGGFAMIDRDNFLRIVELSPEVAMTPIELTTNLYTEDFQNSAKFGEINEFAIGETNLETNAIVRSDDASVAKNGVKKIEILDNMFLGLLEDKETAIEPLWDAFNGFSYYPFKTPYNGYPYIDLGDKINITDINSNVYGTLVLNNVFEYNGGYKGNIGAEALSITAAKYKTNNTLSKQFRKVGIDIDRVEGKITSEIAAATDGITKAYNTAISQTEKNINLSVTEINKVLSGDPAVEGDTGLEGTVNKINQTYLTVDSNDFTVVSSTATEAKKKADKVEENTQKIVSQLHFDAETGLTISAEGSTDDDMKLNLTNSQVNFMYRNSPVLVINGNKIEFTGATFQKFDLGNYVWQAEDDDSLSLIYEGD